MATMAIEQIEAGGVQPDSRESLSDEERIFDELTAAIDSIPANVRGELETKYVFKIGGRHDNGNMERLDG